MTGGQVAFPAIRVEDLQEIETDSASFFGQKQNILRCIDLRTAKVTDTPRGEIDRPT